MNATFIISEEVWEKIAEFYEGLKMIAAKMLIFQRANLTLSDAYAEWIDLKEKLKCIPSTPFVQKLIASMTNRERTIFDSPLIYAAVSLDPRIQLLLSPSQKIDSASFLRTLNGQIQSATQTLSPSQSSSVQPSTSQQSSSQSSSSQANEAPTDSTDSTEGSQDTIPYAGLESVLRSAEYDSENNNVLPPDHRFTLEIELFQKLQRVPMKKPIHEFWHESRKKIPILYDLASVIMAVPPTEVSVERNFSKLNFILNRFRSRLTDRELEKILYLSLNSDLFDLI